VDYVPKFNEYGLLIHDGEDRASSSHVQTRFARGATRTQGPATGTIGATDSMSTV